MGISVQLSMMLLDDFQNLFFGCEVPQAIGGQNQVTEILLYRNDLELWSMLDVGSLKWGFTCLANSVEILLFF